MPLTSTLAPTPAPSHAPTLTPPADLPHPCSQDELRALAVMRECLEDEKRSTRLAASRAILAFYRELHRRAAAADKAGHAATDSLVKMLRAMVEAKSVAEPGEIAHIIDTFNARGLDASSQPPPALALPPNQSPAALLRAKAGTLPANPPSAPQDSPHASPQAQSQTQSPSTHRPTDRAATGNRHTQVSLPTSTQRQPADERPSDESLAIAQR